MSKLVSMHEPKLCYREKSETSRNGNEFYCETLFYLYEHEGKKKVTLRETEVCLEDLDPPSDEFSSPRAYYVSNLIPDLKPKISISQEEFIKDFKPCALEYVGSSWSYNFPDI